MIHHYDHHGLRVQLFRGPRHSGCGSRAVGVDYVEQGVWNWRKAGEPEGRVKWYSTKRVRASRQLPNWYLAMCVIQPPILLPKQAQSFNVRSPGSINIKPNSTASHDTRLNSNRIAGVFVSFVLSSLTTAYPSSQPMHEAIPIAEMPIITHLPLQSFKPEKDTGNRP